VTELSATEAARNFSNILDAVEHRHERFTITRRGKVVAQLEPVTTGRGKEVKALLVRHRADADFARDLASVRDLLQVEERF
jgi:prevent-host-death family protein